MLLTKSLERIRTLAIVLCKLCINTKIILNIFVLTHIIYLTTNCLSLRRGSTVTMRSNRGAVIAMKNTPNNPHSVPSSR